jgi:hypothetical protein
MPLPPTTPAEYSSFTSRLGPDCRDNPDRSTNTNQTKLPNWPCKSKTRTKILKLPGKENLIINPQNDKLHILE